ncbi:hypothetical protein HRE53_30735 (plasmid) [Acaryochloris sp. 'Moss Beach']|uniref:hypothetical protein n=1 Tax=Acaryochloris sp. 'Moss Beach' TaxID=2740837 RepID=UPI001F1A7680|nr:hypothetical protein [Acaryochloris sp. 'Moss Beach']UJB73094.1 hypothetical protein HRE53_30735 [Acaryochloris sp. 'Moss Beach']
MRPPAVVAKAQVAGFNVRLAINDALFSQVTRTVISQEAKKCAQLHPPGVNLTEEEKTQLSLKKLGRRQDVSRQVGRELTGEEVATVYKQASMNQLQCLQSLDVFILEQKKIIKDGCPDCKTALELTERSQEAAQEAIKRNMEGLAVKGFDIAASAAYKTALFAINPGLALAEMIAPDWQQVLTEIAMMMAWIFIASQELSLLLAALLGPHRLCFGHDPPRPERHRGVVAVLRPRPACAPRLRHPDWVCGRDVSGRGCDPLNLPPILRHLCSLHRLQSCERWGGFSRRCLPLQGY